MEGKVETAERPNYRRLREPGAPREPGIGRLCRVPVRDNGEPMVDLREACPNVVPACKHPFLRATAAQMLQQAAESLPVDARLKLATALRTMKQQSDGYWGHYRSLQEKHPAWPAGIVRREANKFWHPPDTQAAPGHSTGGAVDVSLVDAEGAAIDVTSTQPPGLNSQPTYCRVLTPVARENRQVLIRAMSGAGFSNCYDEWWHWSYGDCGWAVRLDRPCALYDRVPESEADEPAADEPASGEAPEPMRDG